MANKLAGITGIRGQDGSYLAEFLLNKGYSVIGIDRRSGNGESVNWRHKELGIHNNPNFRVVYCDITEYESVRSIIEKYPFDEFYNLAAESFVQTSWDHPFHVMNVNTIGHLNILEAIRKYSPFTKLYFASSSETFGKVQEVPQTEKTPFYPRSPYGISKQTSFELTRNYRESYGLFCCSGILFNHESALRGEEFITRKITSNLAKWYYDNSHTFELGNMNAKRDWGDAREYVRAMWMMLQKDVPDDYVIATNETHSIKDFIISCFKYLKKDFKFEDEGLEEKVIVDDKVVISVNKDYYRPCEVDLLLGSSEKAKRELGWIYNSTFEQLVEDMMVSDLKRIKK
jgi:GDPmannose 4,6-dehydratase